MNLIGFIDDQISQQSQLPDWLKDWNARVAVRAILLDENNRIALMHIRAHNSYKLPGGGVDDEEHLETALKREILEETGCTMKFIGDLGIFIERRDDWKMFQVSFVYLAQVIDKGEPILTAEEQADDFALEWIDNLDHALELVLSSESERSDLRYIKLRDSNIIRAAQKKMIK